MLPPMPARRRVLLPFILGVAVVCPVACSASDPPATTKVDAAKPDAPVDAASDATLDAQDTGGLDLDGASDPDGSSPDGGCKDVPPALDAGTVAVTLSAEYAPYYTAYDLGPVPGMPAGHLGGCTLLDGATSTLLFAGESEAATGGLYSIELQRGPCGHIVGFKGTAKKLATTPYIDANLLWLPSGTLLYSQWPQNKLSVLPSGAPSPARDLDLAAVGVDSSIGGIGFVPKSYAAEGQLRGVTWSAGNWFHLELKPDATSWTVASATKKTTLPNGPGGFAYVPAGSPGFAENRIILSEWSADSVATYAVDGQGDPDPATRKAFFESFTKPWGAYFDPLTGDFLFLTWGPAPDRVYVVQGFTKPPPPPPPPA